MNRRLRYLPLLITLVIAATLAGSALTARAATTFVVDDDGAAVPGNCNAATAAPATIQGGIDAAANGDVVEVCPGVYNETPNVNKGVWLRGAQVGVSGASATRTPGGPAESTVQGGRDVGILRVTVNDATIDGFTIRNNDLGPGVYINSGVSRTRVLDNIVTNNVFGVYANGNTTRVAVNRIFDNNQAGAAEGNGVYSDQGLTGSTIVDNTIQNQVNGGVLIVGDPAFAPGAVASTVVIGQNTIANTSPAALGAPISAFGGTGYNIGGNTISNAVADPVNGFAGIFLADVQNSQVGGNAITRAHFGGITVRDAGGPPASGIRISANTITSAGNNGIDVTAAAANAVQSLSNTVTGSGADGIVYGVATKQNRIVSNTVRSSAAFDCHDLGTGNIWQQNKGTTSSPPGRCTP